MLPYFPRPRLSTPHSANRMYAAVAAIAFAACVACVHRTAAAERGTTRPGAADRITSSVPIFDQLLIFGIPRGWRPAYENVSPRKYILEFVPDGQSPESWHEMITVQGFRDFVISSDLTPRLFLALTARRMKELCGDSTVALWLGDRTVDTFDAHAAILGCGHLPSSHPGGIKRGQGEVAYYLAIKGSRDLYVIQRAIRGKAFDPTSPPINPDNLAGLMREVEPIRLCGHDLTPEQCWARSQDPASNVPGNRPARRILEETRP